MVIETTTAIGIGNSTECILSSSVLADVVTPIIYIIICVVGLIGNGLVLWLLIKQDLFDSASKATRSVTNILVINLAIADFIFVGAMPSWTHQRFLKGYWVFGKVGCKLLSFISLLNLYGSVFFLAAMGVDRYLAIVFAVRARQIRTPRNAIRACWGIWLFACLIASQALFFRQVRVYQNCIECVWDIPEAAGWAEAYYASRMGLGFFIPFIIIMYCYLFIIISLKRRSRNVGVSGVNLTETQRKVTRLILCVISMFVVCWLPNHILTLIWSLNIRFRWGIDEYSMEVGLGLSSCLAYANSSLNPILYAFMKDDVRTQMIKLFKSRSGLSNVGLNTKTHLTRDFNQTRNEVDVTYCTPLTPRRPGKDQENNSGINSNPGQHNVVPEHHLSTPVSNESAQTHSFAKNQNLEPPSHDLIATYNEISSSEGNRKQLV